MNGAEFKIIRENLNFSISETARFFEVSERTVRRWDKESSAIPSNVSKIIIDVRNQLNNLVSDVFKKIISENNENANIKKFSIIEKYRNFIRQHGCFYEIPMSTQSYFIYHLILDLEKSGIKTKIILDETDG